MMFQCVAIPLSDATSVGEARRAGLNLGTSLGFNAVKNGELGIIITEAARNAILHGGGGMLIVAGERSSASIRADVLALDRGPGIKDMVRAFEDGYSTAGTSGNGLGAIRRLGAACDIFSASHGTALVATIIQGEPAAAANIFEVGKVLACYPGEAVCGDGVAWEQGPQRTAVMVVDGLGHGPHAAEAADEAVAVFHRQAGKEPGEMLQYIHDGLKKTRGAAVAVAAIHPAEGVLTYAGIGNISATVLADGKTRSLMSHNGIAGHQIHRIQEFKVEWPGSGILIMHSDGVQTRWDPAKYPGLLRRSAVLIAGVLLRDYRRERDDASVLVVKERN
jgi:anti-sigma regulatory factor (Ser/Thr protein kinase)